MITQLDEYQDLANRTGNKTTNPNFDMAIFCMGLAGEAGEFVDYMKKVLGHGHELDKVKAKKELGDVLWYLSVIAKKLELDLSDIATSNIEKLKARYPQGFSEEKSRNRSDGDI